MIIPLRQRQRLGAVLAAAALLTGTLAAVHYHRLDLTLSHYDARAHLVVARRIFDSLTPGWQQIGAVWLPLPHLLNALPVQMDALYRSGLSAVVLSVSSFGVAAGAIARIVLTITGSRLAAAVAVPVFVLNPNVLYLQATPMTEPLLLGLLLAAVALLVEWCAGGSRDHAISQYRARAIGILFALACLTRYEAWPASAAAMAIAWLVVWRQTGDTHGTSRSIAGMAVYPVAAILGFMAFSRVVVGEWFVSSGFFVPDNPARGLPIAVALSLWEGVGALSGPWLLRLGAAGLVAVLAAGLLRRGRDHALVALSLVTTAALPFAAFLSGHPHRIRYMVPLVAAQAVGVGAVVGLARRASMPLAVVAVAVVALELRPVDGSAAMVLEAQWDRPSAVERRVVTECLRSDWDGEVILASMGSLGHYMQELSHVGLGVRDFIHEGNNEVWRRAVVRARPFAGWVLVSERPDGRDALAAAIREHGGLLDGFDRVCEGGQLALYRRRGASTSAQLPNQKRILNVSR